MSSISGDNSSESEYSEYEVEAFRSRTTRANTRNKKHPEEDNGELERNERPRRH